MLGLVSFMRNLKRHVRNYRLPLRVNLSVVKPTFSGDFDEVLSEVVGADGKVPANRVT